MNQERGKLYLIPVPLGAGSAAEVIPGRVLDITRSLRCFIVEELRSARRYLKHIDRNFPIDDTIFFELNEHTLPAETENYLEPALKGNDTGLISEAGMPGIADPGALVIDAAHRKGISVVPLPGPSSVFLALAGSGLNGQMFRFNGYLPIKTNERNNKLRELEKNSGEACPQIFIEAPYRSRQMLEAIISVCQPDTKLCIAADLTLETEFIRTMPVKEWKRQIPELDRRPVVFILQQVLS